MCNAASFIVTKTQVFFGKYHDSHELMITDNGLKDKEPIDFVRTEIVPPNNDYKLPFDKWIFKTDQDILPNWYNMKWAEEQCREALPEWAKTHIYKSGNHKFENGNFSLIFFGNAKAEISSQTGGYCRFWENSTGTVSRQTGGYCSFWENSTGTVSSQTGGSCWFRENSTGTVSSQTGGDCYFWENSTAMRGAREVGSVFEEIERKI